MNFMQGTLDLLILTALSDGELHGYDVVTWIREATNGALRIDDGALYTSLHRMEERGWVESEWGNSDTGKRAKFYRLTAAGRRAVRSETTNWNDYAAAVARVLAATPQPAR